MDNIPLELLTNIITKYFRIDEKVNYKIVCKDFRNQIKLIYNIFDIYFIYQCTDYKDKIFFNEKIRKKEMQTKYLDRKFSKLTKLDEYSYWLNQTGTYLLKKNINYSLDYNNIINDKLESFLPKNFKLINDREFKIVLKKIIYESYNSFHKFVLNYSKIIQINKSLNYNFEFEFEFNEEDFKYIKMRIKKDFNSIFQNNRFKLKFYYSLDYTSFLSIKFIVIRK